MPEEKVLTAVVDANVKPLEKGMADARKALALTAVEANKLDSKLAGGLTKGSNTAALSLINLGRVAQDAPFGFIGIANNLNPLLEGFQRLKAESGSTGNALKALTGSLLGGGGLGLALSAITAIVSFAQLGFTNWTRGMNGSKTALNETAKAAKEAADAYQSIVSSVAKEVGQVEILVEALKNENLSRKQRAEAIKELQKIAPAYFATLDSEKATIDQITKAYDAYSRSIIRSIELKIREGQLNKVIERRLELQDKGNKLTNITVDANGKVQKSYNAIYDPNASGQTGFNKGILLSQDETNELNNLLKSEKELLRDISLLSDPSRFNKVGTPIKEKDVLTVAKVLEQLKRELSEIDAEQAVLGIGMDDYKKKVDAVVSAIKTIVVKLKVDPNNSIVQQLLGNVEDINLQETVRRIKIGFQRELNGTTLIPPPFETDVPQVTGQLNDYTEFVKKGLILRLQALKIKFNPFDTVEGLQKTLNDATARIEAFKASVEKIIYNLKINIATALGEGLGQAILNIGKSGKDIGGAFFAPLLEALGNGLKEFGKQALVANTAIQIIKKTFGKALGIPGAIAAIALGTIITGLAQKLKVPAFANGVTNFSGGLALVGERGPELVTLPGGSSVIPNHQLGDISGAGAISVTVAGSFRAAGRDLLYVIDSATATRSRQG